jgi:hypothetical protein
MRILALALLFTVLTPVPSAFAMKNRTIILRATGSGLVLGLAAGLLSYPFAKSGGTIVAGAAVGAVLGTVYGFYLVDQRDEMYRRASTKLSPLEELFALNESRNRVLMRSRPTRAEFALPISLFEF